MPDHQVALWLAIGKHLRFIEARLAAIEGHVAGVTEPRAWWTPIAWCLRLPFAFLWALTRTAMAYLLHPLALVVFVLLAWTALAVTIHCGLFGSALSLFGLILHRVLSAVWSLLLFNVEMTVTWSLMSASDLAYYLLFSGW